MRRLVLMSLVVLLANTLAPTAHAGDAWVEFWNRFHLDFERNRTWPTPFVERSRCVTREYFAIMKANGWRDQNTLTGYHFEDQSARLNRGGRAKLDWIVNNAPPQRKAVLVVRGANDDLTEKRLDAVQQALTRLQPEGELPPVLVAEKAPPTNQGYYYSAIQQQMQENVPSPVLTGGGNLGGGDSAP